MLAQDDPWSADELLANHKISFEYSGNTNCRDGSFSMVVSFQLLESVLLSLTGLSLFPKENSGLEMCVCVMCV